MSVHFKNMRMDPEISGFPGALVPAPLAGAATNGTETTVDALPGLQSRAELVSRRLSDEQALYDYLADVSGPHTRVTPGVNTTRFRNGKDLYGSYHYEKFYYPSAFRDTLRRLQKFQAPLDMQGWTVYEFGCCIGALSLECVRRGAHASAWEYNPSKVLGCQRLASFLRLSSQQVSFYQQDLIAWLKDPVAMAEFQLKFPPRGFDHLLCHGYVHPQDLAPGSLPASGHLDQRSLLVRKQFSRTASGSDQALAPRWVFTGAPRR